MRSVNSEVTFSDLFSTCHAYMTTPGEISLYFWADANRSSRGSHASLWEGYICQRMLQPNSAYERMRNGGSDKSKLFGFGRKSVHNTLAGL